jgi:ethanolamine permease
LPLAAEESVDPKRDMPRGIIAGMLTLVVSAFMILWLNPSVEGVGAQALSTSGEPLLDGFRAIYGEGIAQGARTDRGCRSHRKFPHDHLRGGTADLFPFQGRLLPSAFSVTHRRYKTSHVAMIVGSVVALAVMFVLWFSLGAEAGGTTIGGTLLNMAVFGAMCSYVLQALSFILLRRNQPHIQRPYRSPLGVPGAAVTIVIAVVTVFHQLSDPVLPAGRDRGGDLVRGRHRLLSR